MNLINNKNYFRKSTIEKWVVRLIKSLKDDPKRDGLIDTPNRLANMWTKLLVGQRFSDDELFAMYNQTYSTDTQEVIHIKEFSIKAVDEMYLLPYKLDIELIYKPKNKIIDMNVLYELVYVCGRRIRTQKSLGKDIFNLLSRILETNDIAIKLVGHYIESDVLTHVKQGIYEQDENVFIAE